MDLSPNNCVLPRIEGQRDDQRDFLKSEETRGALFREKKRPSLAGDCGSLIVLSVKGIATNGQHQAGSHGLTLDGDVTVLTEGRTVRLAGSDAGLGDLNNQQM